MGLTIVQTRGGHVESSHPVAAVLVGPDGAVHERIGEPYAATWRSAAKPFQLEVTLGLLPEEAQGALSEREIAVGSSSHHGEPGHVAQVEGVLSRFGCAVGDLFCGVHWPGDVPATHALLREHQPATAIHNNCSGKHAFMASACRVQGWSPDYRDPAHPLMAQIRDNIQRRTGGRLLDEVTDGCGVPCYVVPLAGMAQAWAQIADSFGGSSRLGRIGRAMQAHPWHASGTGAIDGHLMQYAKRPIVAKVGAEGLICVAIPGERRGVALKMTSGSNPARALAIHVVLERWFPGLLPAESAVPYLTVKNWVGTVCGAFEARDA